MRILILLLSFLLLSPTAWASYQDPQIKVLLVKAKQSLKFTSRRGIEIYGATQPFSKPRSITIRNLGRGKVKIGKHAQTTRPFFLSSESPIHLQGRSYEGELEIRPFRGGFYVVNHINTENYLQGVLNAEISTKWNMEVVKAQAILARTYALRKARFNKNKAWHLQSGHMDQVYKGVGLSDRRGRLALTQTRGYVVKYQGRLADVFYHSNCGGYTEDPGNLWAYSLPYYSIKEVPFGHEDPNYYWQTFLSYRQMAQTMKRAGIPDAQHIEIHERNESNRVQELLVQGQQEKVITAKNFRRLVGYTKVKSLIFEIEPVAGGWQISGQGSGHGVGMCQWAAKEMADTGYKYWDILYYFYDGIDIEAYGLN